MQVLKWKTNDAQLWFHWSAETSMKLNEKDIEEILKTKTGKNRLNEIRKLVKNVTYCSKSNYGCGTPVPKIKLEINFESFLKRQS